MASSGEGALSHGSDRRTSGRREAATLFSGVQSAGKSSPIPIFADYVRREPWRQRGAYEMTSTSRFIPFDVGECGPPI